MYRLTGARRKPHAARRLCAALAAVLSVVGTIIPATAAAVATVTPGALPGAPTLPPEIARRLEAALAERGGEYRPRTEHLRADGSPRYTNRLLLEHSPYLQQHAHNPVDWHPWGAAAFERARRERRPIFLSIGYSTCHWCHVMERESFDNVAIATLLNERFVAIKVDRERRPDLDEIYMTAVRMIIGRGGWPMSVFLTPDGEPFYGATYFPPTEFKALLERVDRVWHSDREAIVASAGRIAEAVRAATAARSRGAGVDSSVIAAAVDEVVFRYEADAEHAPKFPHESELLLLLETALRVGDREALESAVARLDGMARGGVFDQIGGGFHRYATDSQWRIPHFEKMLYNQALLARAYVLAYEITGNTRYARVATETLDYVLRELTSPEGVFYSATDADSAGREGAYFVWTMDEIESALNAADAELATAMFGVTTEGNFGGHNVLHLPVSLEAFAAERGMTPSSLEARRNEIRAGLRAARSHRVPPLVDEKVLVAWNGLMITALAMATEPLADARYRDAAERAAEHLWHSALDGEAGLRRVLLDGRASVAATLEDHAFFAEALLALYDASGQRVWIERARMLVDEMLANFWDEAEGGFFMTAGDDPNLIARPKSPADGAVPSANAAAVRALTGLARRTGEDRFADRARATLAAFGGVVRKYPDAFAYLLLGAQDLVHGAVGRRQHAAAGNVVVNARATPGSGPTARLEISLAIAEGWHVNAHEPLQSWLIPTALSTPSAAWAFRAVRYPPARTVGLSFQPESLAVYEGPVRIVAELEPVAASTSAVDPIAVPVELTLQACNDELCLPPENIVLEIPVAALRRIPQYPRG